MSSHQRARIWVGPYAPSDPPNKPLDVDCCFWFDTANDVWKRLTSRLPVDVWTEAAAPSGVVAWDDITGKPSTFPPTIGSTGTTAVAGDDARLTDARTPTTHSHAISDTTGLQAALDAKSATSHNHNLNDLTEKSYNSLANKPTLGTAAALNVAASGDATAGEVVKGNDTRMTNARTPASHGNEAHSSTFVTSSAVTYANLSANGSVGTGASQVAVGNHTHANDHARSHSITSASDHTFPGGTSTFLRADGTFATPGGGSDPWTYVKLASDFPTTSNTAVSVTGLAFTPVINSTYIIEGTFMMRTATATVGPRPGCTWPTSATDGVMAIQTTSSATANVFASGNISGAVLTPVGGLPTTTGSWPAFLWGTLVTGASTSGNFQVTLASETAGTSVTMKAGSWIRYRTI